MFSQFLASRFLEVGLTLVFIAVSTAAGTGVSDEIVSAVPLAASFLLSNEQSLVTAKTWDGGGTTNNWSEAANWSDDIVPAAGDTVIFDGTSTKNSVIDTNITIAAIQIAAGYSGTISQSDAAAITISGCPSRTCFVQEAGTFNGSSNTISINSSGFGAITMQGGSFNGGSGDIALVSASGVGSNLLLLGGTFTSTSGNLTVPSDLILQGAGTAFIHNNGKVTFNGSQSGFLNADSSHPTTNFHDVEVNLSSGASYTFLTRAIVEGNLLLTDGSIEQNGSTVESRGGLTIAPTFDGGNATLELANGSSVRNLTFDSSLRLPRVVVNDPNVTLNISGSGTVTFPRSFSLLEGTVNQGSVDILIGPPPSGGFSYIQSGGLFNGSSKSFTANSNGFGSFNQSGGTFIAGSGDISMTGTNAELTVSGGTFTSTTGTLTASSSFRMLGGTFNHNNGTVTFTGGGSPTIDVSAFGSGLTFNNVNFNRDNGSGTFLFGKMVTIGTLGLNDGAFTNNGIIEVRAGLNIASTFDGGGPSNLLIANGNGPRTFTLDTSYTLPFITLNDPNVTLNTSGPGTLNFPRAFALQQGVFNQGNVDLDFFPVVGGGASYSQSGGTFNGSPKSLTFTSSGFGGFNQSGGIFNAGSGDITLNGTGSTFTLSGGTFTSTPGVLTASSDLRIQGGTFNHNNGTVTFTGSGSPGIDVSAFASGLTFRNVNFNRDNGSVTFLFGKMITIGTLSLNDGGFTNNGSIEVRGGLNIASTFDGGGPNNLLIANGSGPRTFSFDTSLTLPFVTLDDPNVTLNTSGSGTLNWPHGFRLQQGVFNQGNVDLDFFPVPGGSFTPYSQSGGTFNGSSNSIFATGNGFGGFSQSGGSFNAGSGDITLNGTGSSFTLSGGTFNSTSGNLTASADFRIQGGAFNHNNGTVTLTGGGSPTIDLSTFAAGVAFNNVSFSRDNGSGTFLFGKMITAGTLSLSDGGFTNNGTLEAQGNVSIAGTFDGGGPNAFTFSGSATQTFTNNGGPNPPGIWTLNKTGGTVNLASNLDLSNGSASGLNLTAGTISTGNFEINAATRTITRTAGYISGNLRRDFSTTGIKTYDVGTANSYAPVSVNVLAPLSGTQGLTVGEFQGAHPNLDPSISLGRFWTLVEHGTVTANLTFNYIDPLDIHGSETAYRVAQIDSNVNFFTEAQIPINRTANSFTINNVTDYKSYSLGQPVVSISPANISLQVQGTQTFIGSGGTSPYSFIMAGNSSFGSVNPTTGLYTAGTHAGGQDSVKVTDSEGRIAFATIDVQPGAATKLGFGVPLNTVNINTPISPPPMFVIQDQFGNPVTTAADPVTISIANNPGGGTLSGTLIQNALNGVATFNDLSINALGNGYSLAATSGSLTPAATNAFNVLGPAQLAFINEQAATPIIQNAPFSLQVEVRDQFGARFTNASNPVTLAISNNPGGGTLSGVTTQNASNGVAFFSGLSIDAPGNGYTFNATSPTLVPATSLSYNIVSPFVVTNKTDGLPGSLRSAIIAANTTPGAQTISFNIPGPAPYGIVLTTPLPAITDTVVIDGTTQPGFAGSPVIEINGQNVVGSVSGISLQAANSTIKGLSVTRFSNSQFSSGISVSPLANNNTIQGNWVGVSPAGTAAGNGNGILIASRDNLIGGPNGPDRNVISGNVNFGLEFVGANKPNTIQGNYIGTNATGNAAMGNKNGLLMSGSDTVRDNVISGNTSDAIISTGDPNNSIQNNLIGLDATGITTVGNGGSGINLGTSSGSGNRITGNRIFGNALLGIKLGNRTTTAAGPALPNDPLDPDTGPNNLQNYPVLTSIVPSAGSTMINGTLNSTPSSSYTLEFFSNPTCDASGNGEGETFLGTASTNTDANGNATFSTSLPVTITNTRFVTATATDAGGNTSEFSACKGPQANIQGTVKTPGGQPISGVLVKLANLSNGTSISATTGSFGNFTFPNQPQGQNYVVTPTKTNLVMSPATATHNNLSTDQNDAFIGTVQTFSISGQTTVNSNALGGVTMTLSGATNGTANTDSSGNYSFGNLPAGTYTVTPGLQNFSFTPSSRTFTLSSNQAANFAGTNLLASLTGRIAFSSSGDIKAMNADGSGIVTVVPKTSSLTFKFPSVSANGAKFAFIEQTIATGADSLIISNPDGSGQVNRAALGSAASVVHLLSWSTDGTKIATSWVQGGVTQLISVATTTGAISPIMTTGVSNLHPDWSPDGTKLAFARDDSSTPGSSLAIFTANADGTGLQKLTTPSGSDLLPKWSPDGTKIAFLRSPAGVSTEVVVMSSTGIGQTTIYTTTISQQLFDLEWSPDGSRLAILKGDSPNQKLVSILPDGTGELVISPAITSTSFDWGNNNTSIIPTGRVIINLPPFPIPGGVPHQASPTVTVEPISPNSLGAPPAGFVLGNFAYDISTADAFTPPATVCLTLPAEGYPTAASFNALSLLHLDIGGLTDVTTIRDFASRQLCGQSNTLGAFVVAEQVNNALPSIVGLVTDQNGVPLSDMAVSLTGDASQQTTTDIDGAFSFVNLTAGGNYVATPVTPGYTSNAPFAGFAGISGEQTVVFVATPANVSISGTVRDADLQPAAGVTVHLSGATDAETTTDADGNYAFGGLQANTSYAATPIMDGTAFAPALVPLNSLQNDAAGVDFVISGPSAANASIAGRIIDRSGNGIGKVLVKLSGGHLQNPVTLMTNGFGYYRFDDVTVGESYVLTVSSKRYVFANPSRLVNLLDDVSDADFVGESP